MSITSLRAGWLSLWLLTAMGAAGLAWRECVLVGAALMVAHRLFLWRTDIGAPWDGFRLGVRCASTGLIGLLMSIGLAALAAAGLSGLLAMAHPNAASVVLALMVAAAIVVVVQIDAPRRVAEIAFSGAMVIAAALAYAAFDAGWNSIPCVLTLSMALYLTRENWRLVRAGVEAFLPCGPR